MRNEQLTMGECDLEDFVEMRILEAVRKMLVGRVNDILAGFEFQMPVIEFGEYAGVDVVVPVIGLSSCERSEKERIVRVEAFLLSISFSVPDTPESELYCYAIAAAVEKAMGEDCTLGGIADRVVLTGKKYTAPKTSRCGEGREIVLNIRITVEARKQ